MAIKIAGDVASGDLWIASHVGFHRMVESTDGWGPGERAGALGPRFNLTNL
jgi:hypothetical protein